MTDGQTNTTSWWQTLPGILTAVGGVLAALTALIGTLHQAGVVGEHGTNTPTEKAAIKQDYFEFSLSDPASEVQSPASLEKKLEITTGRELKMSFRLSSKACSEIRINVSVDNDFKVSTPYFDDEINNVNLGPVAKGRHVLRLRPEGQLGGCNPGRLVAWGGKLTVDTSE